MNTLFEKESECPLLNSHSLLLQQLPRSPHIQVTRLGTSGHTQSTDISQKGRLLRELFMSGVRGSREHCFGTRIGGSGSANTVMEAENRQPWLCMDNNAHTPDSR